MPGNITVLGGYLTISQKNTARFSSALRGHAAMLSFSALVAGSFSLGSLAANEIEPGALITMRFLIAAIAVAILAPVFGVKLGGVRNATWRFLILGGLFAFYFLLMFEGLKTGTPVSLSAVFTLTPLISAGFAWVLLRQITTPRMALALAIGGVGAIWVIFQADLAALLTLRVGRGEFIFFWGMLAHALYTPMARLLHRGENPIVMTLGTLIAGSLVLVIYAWSDILATDWLNLPVIVWITIFYMAILSGALSLVLIQYATLTLPSAKVMAYTYLTPSWVILWEISLGHGVPDWLVIGGVVLTAVALLLLLRDDERKRFF